jgi:hypothetical protein
MIRRQAAKICNETRQVTTEQGQQVHKFLYYRLKKQMEDADKESYISTSQKERK